MSLSRAQHGKYRPLVDRAWRAACERDGADPSNKVARDGWYREQLMDACGIFTTKEAHPVRDFDKLMLHFAQIANDEFWISRISEADERRMRWQMRRFLQDLSWLLEEPCHWSYMEGLYDQAQLYPSLDDAPAEVLQKALQMLDTHIRRICRRRGIRPMDLPTRRKPERKQFVVSGSRVMTRRKKEVPA